MPGAKIAITQKDNRRTDAKTHKCDEVYVVAGHTGNPAAVREKGRKGRRNRLKGARGRGTLEKEKPPIFGMIQRSGEMVIQMLPNVQQVTIAPLIYENPTSDSPFLLRHYPVSPVL